MKRLSPDDSSLDALIPICPNSTDEECNNPMLQAMLEEEEECGDGRIAVEKKRRLSVDQVRALEKNFEVENKLEPERKVKLAQELGLQPRQVAVWFQNRRARWKTKQLEKDYGVLKANYDSLKLSFDKLHHENETLLNQIEELKSKLNEETKTRVVKEEGMEDQRPNNTTTTDEDNETPNLSDELLKLHEEEEPTSGQQQQQQDQTQIHVSMFFTDHGSSDSSESSAILNEDNTNTTAAAVSSYSGTSMRGGLGFLQKQQVSVVYNETHEHQHPQHHHLHQFVKIEEHNFFGEEESCSGLMFAEDQAPTLQHWYSSDEWDLN